jgi:hypothetical protein
VRPITSPQPTINEIASAIPVLKNGSVSHPDKHVVYKAKKPIKAVTEPPIKETTIPAGSILVWRHGDSTGEMAHVSWLRQRVHVKQADLFGHCERITEPDTLT